MRRHVHRRRRRERRPPRVCQSALERRRRFAQCRGAAQNACYCIGSACNCSAATHARSGVRGSAPVCSKQRGRARAAVVRVRRSPTSGRGGRGVAHCVNGGEAGASDRACARLEQQLWGPPDAELTTVHCSAARDRAPRGTPSHPAHNSAYEAHRAHTAPRRRSRGRLRRDRGGSGSCGSGRSRIHGGGRCGGRKAQGVPVSSTVSSRLGHQGPNIIDDGRRHCAEGFSSTWTDADAVAAFPPRRQRGGDRLSGAAAQGELGVRSAEQLIQNRCHLLRSLW